MEKQFTNPFAKRIGNRLVGIMNIHHPVTISLKRACDRSGTAPVDTQINHDLAMVSDERGDIEVEQVGIHILNGMCDARSGIVGSVASHTKFGRFLDRREQPLLAMQCGSG